MEETTTETVDTKEEKKIIETFDKEIENYRQSTTQQRSDINDIYNSYIGNMEAVKKVPYFEPITIPKLRTEIAYIVPNIFSGKPEIEIEGVGAEDKDLAFIFQKIVNFRLDTIPQAYEKIEAWVKQSVTFGTSILRVNWLFETEEAENEAIEGEEATTYEKPVKDEPSFDVPNILDCFYSPILPDIYCQNSVIFRSVLPIEEVKNDQKYDYEGAEGLNRERIEGKPSTINTFDSSTQVDSDAIDIKQASTGTVEVYERITNDRIQTVAYGKEKLVLRDKPLDYGFINAVKLTHEPNCIPNRFDGFGVGHNTLGLSKAYHSIVNQTKTNITLANNPMFYGRKGANIKKPDLIAKPGGFIEVDGQGPLSNDFAQVDFQDIKQGALEFINLLDDEHKRASGANDLVQGGASNDTLGQDEMANANASNRFELVRRRFKQALADVAEILIKLELKNLQSVDAPILRIFPPEMRQYVYEMLIQEANDKSVRYDISVKGDTNIVKNKDVQIKQLIDWFNLFGQILPPQNQMETAKKILELRGIDDVDKLVPEIPEGQQEGPMMPQEMGGAPTQRGINQQTYQI